jgi:hypothetical protein
MGTGVFTANPMMVAEELQCDWSKVRAEFASANRDAREKAPAWTLKFPNNDIGAAATEWKVPVSERSLSQQRDRSTSCPNRCAATSLRRNP